MLTLLLQPGRASPSPVSMLSDGSWTETATRFEPLTIPLILLVALATALILRAIEVTIRSIAGAFKSVVGTGLTLMGVAIVMILIVFAMTVILTSPT